MAFAISPFLDIASKLSNIKKTETIMPIARLTGYETPMLVGDDLSLRSSVMSPAGYDREMIRILHGHSEIIENNETVKFSYEKFCSSLSNPDKISLLWALYKATYEILAKDKLMKCPKETCKHEFKTDISLEELVHDDTYKVWEEMDSEGKIVPFTAFRFPIYIEEGDAIYAFNTKLPSIQDNNRVLGLIPIEVLQTNLDKIGNVFSKPQQMILVTEAIQISSKNKLFEPVTSNEPNEMLVMLENYVSTVVSEQFFEKYNEKFGDYNPKFYKMIECPQCKNTFKHEVDLEVEFFRRSIFGR